MRAIPDGWRTTTLGALCREAGGDIQTGPFGSQLHASDYVAVGIPSVMPQNIGDNVISDEDIARISPADAKRLSKYLLHENDIVYSRRGDVEKRALVRAENDGWLCGTGCLRVRFGNSSACDPRFVSYFLGTQESRTWIKLHAVGATMPNLNTSILSALPVRVPEPHVQRAIADVLGALDDKIASTRHLAQISDHLAAALVCERVIEDEMILVADVASVTMGSSPPGDSYNEDGNGMVFYQGNRDFGFRSPTNRLWTVDPRRVAEAGDTLLSVRAPVGELNVANEKTCIGRGLASLRSKDELPSLLFHRLRVVPGLWDRFESGGTVFGSINGKELNSLPIPRIADGQSLEPKLAELDKIVASAEAESRTLAVLRDTLLPRLMSGELRVKDAEAVVADAV
ncbi:restriction endonuclease subunit S [Rhodococcus aetherivorans]|uniref:restriction endonuclease subunit S n=1 Tax=Rhodococcus aetherivorans TaxID=191292 RepID=UPI000B0F68EF|nr:restriction endonuclease subunit S [Rhodococcus aetherivorans]